MHGLSTNQVEKICELLNECGQQARQMATNPFQVFEKGVEDYVTEVDRLLDKKLTAEFTALFPQDGVITEENAASRIAFQEKHSRLWLIDPIDGTDDFIQGKAYYSIMIGLLQAGQPIAGWVYAPALDHLYWGGSDWGLFQITGFSATASGKNRLPELFIPQEPPPPSANFCPILLGDKDQRNFGKAIAQVIPAAQFDTVGSFGLKVMQVISGQAGLYVYLNRRVKLWDTTGPLAMAKAAGLVCCDLDGEPLRFTPDAVDPETLAHRQPIIIGWSRYVEELRSRLKQAVRMTKEHAGK